ncbi:MAG: hypothetical protein H8E71_04185 [Candidatus Marinimicrobia bacterium]|nr:hypothetical protein [Candidatus Neomarinimicrobiota bacterium]
MQQHSDDYHSFLYNANDYYSNTPKDIKKKIKDLTEEYVNNLEEENFSKAFECICKAYLWSLYPTENEEEKARFEEHHSTSKDHLRTFISNIKKTHKNAPDFEIDEEVNIKYKISYQGTVVKKFYFDMVSKNISIKDNENWNNNKAQFKTNNGKLYIDNLFITSITLNKSKKLILQPSIDKFINHNDISNIPDNFKINLTNIISELCSNNENLIDRRVNKIKYQDPKLYDKVSLTINLGENTILDKKNVQHNKIELDTGKPNNLVFKENLFFSNPVFFDTTITIFENSNFLNAPIEFVKDSIKFRFGLTNRNIHIDPEISMENLDIKWDGDRKHQLSDLINLKGTNEENHKLTIKLDKYYPIIKKISKTEMMKYNKFTTLEYSEVLELSRIQTNLNSVRGLYNNSKHLLIPGSKQRELYSTSFDHWFSSWILTGVWAYFSSSCSFNYYDFNCARSDYYKYSKLYKELPENSQTQMYNDYYQKASTAHEKMKKSSDMLNGELIILGVIYLINLGMYILF